jgi:biotin transport system substrate-specific component
MTVNEKSLSRVNPVPSLVLRFSISIGMAIVIALSAKLGFMTPLSPVPVTFQVASVLLAGFILGPLWGPISVFLYIAAGFVGVPVFAMGIGGPAVVLQPSFGYILAFPIAAWIVGWVSQKGSKGILRGTLIGFMGVAVIYLIGASWLCGYLLVGGSGLQNAIQSAWLTGIVPFILVDAMKVLLVSGIWSALKTGK